MQNNPYLSPFSVQQLLPPIQNYTDDFAPKNSLCLNQIADFEPVKQFTDDNNTVWTLTKSSSDSTVDVPDPSIMQIVDYWNHEYPGIKTKLYIYVVEGIRKPRVETERPCHVLYQWFSTIFVPTFTPQMITQREWLRANVYTAPVNQTRMSKLKALCKISDSASFIGPPKRDELITVQELTGEADRKN